ncbi:hypothetical protein ASPWEDRAFT_40178 [Aspergillus wentii DTO 134E9]|uniref:AB hydrolase-1 domain-containing protein n=1 Tax=Aspergillus wentii DTO 134E9 TaxID=1073089 RepID=A0A1L9RJE1_ASPWE|nr:uncharacterized protein ASPWEDRAFT_40178 [Aspergillus wentii DTO 134E9]KAI9931995.1 hypothetical protein MW887_009498 [Aspergillus wentii]OJJ35049.1 hypothetical protein ASPWEDRAFT_40178 [Aspergillus wentii DTO 134E9]
MPSKPTIVLVLGAWCLPPVYEQLQSRLSRRNIPSESPAHPSIGAEPPTKTLTDDVSSLRQTLTKLVEEGKDVVVVGHSYGGVVTSNAVEGLSKADRSRQGKKGGVVLVVYMSAFVLPKGTSLKDMLGGEFLPWMNIDGDYVSVDNRVKVGFHDVSPDEQEKWSDSLTHTSIGVFSGASTYEPWHSIPSAYILCEEDQALPFPIQEHMAGTLGTEWIYSLKSSHFPFLSMPDRVADILEELADRVQLKLAKL